MLGRCILLVEDERKLADAIAEGLRGEGYLIDLCASGEDALASLQKQHYDLVLLDVMLPKKSGLEVLGEMRRSRTHTRVLVLTSRDAVEDRVLGLDAGADDYLVKPFAFAELLARVRALSRRNPAVGSSVLEMSDLKVDLKAKSAWRAGKKLDLTLREFEIVEYLLENKDAVVSKGMLARDVWKQAARYTPLDNVIDVQMTRLRRKLDGDRSSKLLHTVRGVGYVMREGE